MHQKTKKSAFVGEALTENGKILQESSARESDVRFPGEESGTKAGLRCHRARHATAPLWRKAQSVIAPPERKARRENTLPMRKSGARRILRRMSTVRKHTFPTRTEQITEHILPGCLPQGEGEARSRNPLRQDRASPSPLHLYFRSAAPFVLPFR